MNDEQKNELLGRARALIVPVEWDEPFGLVFLEALACGTPVISMTRGALFELIEHGRQGYLCSEPRDLPGAIAQIGEIDRADCRRRATKFCSAFMAARHEILYTQLTRYGSPTTAHSEIGRPELVERPVQL